MRLGLMKRVGSLTSVDKIVLTVRSAAYIKAVPSS
jgi:hypothetical protein